MPRSPAKGSGHAATLRGTAAGVLPCLPARLLLFAKPWGREAFSTLSWAPWTSIPYCIQIVGPQQLVLREVVGYVHFETAGERAYLEHESYEQRRAERERLKTERAILR